MTLLRDVSTSGATEMRIPIRKKTVASIVRFGAFEPLRRVYRTDKNLSRLTHFGSDFTLRRGLFDSAECSNFF